MKTNPLILMVTESSASFDSLTQSLEACGSQCHLLRVSNLPMALARVAGGGVKSIVVDCSNPDFLTPGNITELRDCVDAQSLSVLLWSDGRAPLASTLIKETGATGWVTPNTSLSELKKKLLAESRPRLVEVEDKSRTGASTARGSSGRPVPLSRKVGPTPMPSRPAVIAVMGGKGGIGTTTVAMNLAAGLAERGSVILAEVRSTFGSLHGHFHPGRMVRGVASLGDSGATEVGSVLWPVPSVPGLRILFGPHTAAECAKIDSSHALAIIDELASEAEFVVLDLPVSLGSVNRAILGASDYLTLVLEPAPTCMELGKATLEGIQSWDKAPASIGAVMVKRRPEGPPLNLPELEAELGVPVLRVIPPAPELCVVSELAHIPILQADPDSLAAESMLALARIFHSRNAHFKPNHSWDIDYRGSLSGL